MGVSGAVGLLFKRGNAWMANTELRDMYVVLDLTHGLYWFVKRQLLDGTHMDRYGTSLAEVGALYRRFFNRLRERNVTPIVVLDGGRKSEQRYGPLVSKAAFLQRSCVGALRNLHPNRNGRRQQLWAHLPELANNAIKEILAELKIEHVVQAHYEVYPVLEHWAREKQCPVITNHSDFILRDVPCGFIWTQNLQLPTDSSSPFMCGVYYHDRMLRQFHLEPTHSSALKTLSVLLRDDFCDAYYPTVNQVLGLTHTDVELTGQRQDRKKTQRLIYLLENCHRNPIFTSSENVRAALNSRVNAISGQMMRDYDAVYDSYATYYADFGDCEFAQWFGNRSRSPSDRKLRSSGASSPRSPSTQSNQLTHQALLDALTLGEATAEFVSTLGATAFGKPVLEDTNVFRSTFSLHDNCRQFLLDHTMVSQISHMHIYDRCRNEMRSRQLHRRGHAARSPTSVDSEPAGRINQDTLFRLFHFNARQLELLASKLTNYGIDQDNSFQLALELLLARFACNIMYRDHYSNAEDSVQTLTNTESTSLGSSSNEGASPKGRALYERKKMFLTAIMNSYIYHARTGQGDQTNQEVPSDIRVARAKMTQVAKDDPSMQPGSGEYYRIKHMIEALNSVMHGYKELNSLYNFPGPNFHVTKYYDGVLIFKIMSKWSVNLQGYLLRIGDDILIDLIGKADN